MALLTATFRISLPEPVLLEQVTDNPIHPVPEDDCCFSLVVNGLEVTLKLLGVGGVAKQPRGGQMVTIAQSVEVTVAREEPEQPPPKKADRRDTVRLQTYLMPRYEEFATVAALTLRRLSEYFRFLKGNPLVMDGHEQGGQAGFLNPVWHMDGDLLFDKRLTVSIPPSYALRLFPYWHVQPHSPSDRTSLESALANGVDVTLRDEFLANARDAIALGNFRRAVMELAITCEFVVKQKFFEPDTAAGAAFEYLEDKGRVHVVFLEYLSTMASRSFGCSFKDEHPGEYEAIDFLFRCRNKIVHRGSLKFRNDQNEEVEPDELLIREWWNAVNSLLAWIDRLP